MKLEEKLIKLGFTQNPRIKEQWSNREFDVNVYVENDKIVGVQICKDWCLKFHDFRNYGDYLTKLRCLLKKIDCIL